LLILTLTLLIGGLFMMTFASSADAGAKIGVIVVDMQGDFTTYKNGSLAVAGTDQAFVEKVEKTTLVLKEKGYPVFATQDWHPPEHVSFYTNHAGKKPFEAIQLEGRTQVLWPPHCVQNTANAEVLLDNNMFIAVVRKGKDKRYDSYSGFQDDGGAKTEMNQILKNNDIQELIVYGIATDYCVKATAIDAVDAGYKVTVVEGLSKGVAPDTTAKALEEMKAKGITLVKELD
ncbi:MAG: bifunctional nicotinamidase/pyrazinamidase, partial [Desulfobacterales bacterium]|nr:bifunctional nicotinamidase/pyrazinamidase [Desulfobacterales bacterium]